MISGNKNTISNIVPSIFLIGVLLGLILVFLGRLFVPATSFLSIAGACFILIAYGLIGVFVFPHIQSKVLTPATIFGLFAGIIFASEILLEYALLPKDNSSWGIIEFGSVFVLYFLSGVWVAHRHKSIKNGVSAAVIAAMLSSVIWLIFVLITYYLFRGTTQQELVFKAEGNFQDFARSGMSDFNAFVMEDFLGACFFHLSLTPIVAAILGVIGGTLEKGFAKLRKH